VRDYHICTELAQHLGALFRRGEIERLFAFAEDEGWMGKKCQYDCRRPDWMASGNQPVYDLLVSAVDSIEGTDG
jgi:hypothetical protein